MEEILINVWNYIRMDKDCYSNLFTAWLIEAVFPVMVSSNLHTPRKILDVCMKCFSLKDQTSYLTPNRKGNAVAMHVTKA